MLNNPNGAGNECIHLTTLSFNDFKMIEAMGLKIIASSP
jgi:hypothetical protein